METAQRAKITRHREAAFKEFCKSKMAVQAVKASALQGFKENGQSVTSVERQDLVQRQLLQIQ
jgi:hypothetical protein